MKKILISIWFLLFVFVIYGQRNNQVCKCPKNNMVGIKEGLKPDTSFIFSTNQQIILCGYKEIIKNETYFSEFILQICGRDSIIDYWGATQTCKIHFNNDTLNIIGLKNLPTGLNRDFILTNWIFEDIFFSDGYLRIDYHFNKKIRKYNNEEIQITIKEYENANDSINDNKLDIASRLFMSSISGSKTALKYFKEFKTKYGPLDGAFAEDYKELQAMLETWEVQ